MDLSITWRDVDQSDAIEADIREKAHKLEQFYEEILRCRIIVESSQRRHHKGNLYRLHILLNVPDKEIVVTRDPAENHAHEDIYVSIRDAFDAARRQLQDYARIRRGKVKLHPEHQLARVRMLKPDEDYGILETADGREIYFHRHALINKDFAALEEGVQVSFIEEQGREGPQAMQVSFGKHSQPRED